ncbi:DUF6538 domain-containing protein [Nitrospirillum sp. BR 11752]|uniref:DUF6538 domain-containing protein n=1 Tax=Nitrospirillum sp. BR 11752 TaxID=3104293 RepID=UPI002EA1008F|nr:DUF6538 domain-containing protein [Nitrospirillum sp. BR 11752]
MASIPYIVQRRQRLYLRVRQPADVAALTGRTHYVRSLRTNDPRQARATAAKLLVGAHHLWGEVRRTMLAALLGKPVEDLTVGDLQVMDMAQYAAMVGQIEALPEAERQRAVAHCSSLYTQWDLTRKQGELEVDQTELRTEQVNHATRRLLDAVDGLEHDRSAKDMLERVSVADEYSPEKLECAPWGGHSGYKRLTVMSGLAGVGSWRSTEFTASRSNAR